jgi:hypothetical protein
MIYGHICIYNDDEDADYDDFDEEFGDTGESSEVEYIRIYIYIYVYMCAYNDNDGDMMMILKILKQNLGILEKVQR